MNINSELNRSFKIGVSKDPDFGNFEISPMDMSVWAFIRGICACAISTSLALALGHSPKIVPDDRVWTVCLK